MADFNPTGNAITLPSGQPTRSDVKAAENRARETALLLALLLLARAGRKSAGGIVWDKRRGVFIDIRRRRVITSPEIRRLLAQLTADVEGDLDEVAERLLANNIALGEWQKQSRGILLPALILAAVIGRGGLAQMKPTDWERFVAATQIQWDALERFAAELAAAGMPPNKIKARIRSYAASINAAYHQNEQVVQASLGKTQARRHLTAAEHCQPCVDHAGRWMPIAEMPPIGSFAFQDGGCAQFCKCFLTFK